jgi:anthranilate synthase component I
VTDPAISPDRDTFVALAADHDVVPVSCELLADLDTPVSVYTRLRGQGPTFLLESAEHGQRWGRYSFIGTDPFLVLRGRDGQVSWEGTPPAAARDADGPLAALDAAMRSLRAPAFPSLPLHGGAVGMIGYDAIREVEDIPDTGRDDLALPDVLMLFPRHVIGMDHLRQTMTVVTNVVIGDDPVAQYDQAVAQTRDVITRLASAGPAVAPRWPRPRWPPHRVPTR